MNNTNYEARQYGNFSSKFPLPQHAIPWLRNLQNSKILVLRFKNISFVVTRLQREGLGQLCDLKQYIYEDNVEIIFLWVRLIVKKDEKSRRNYITCDIAVCKVIELAPGSSFAMVE